MISTIPAIMSTEMRHSQMQMALDHDLPFLKKLYGHHDEWINIICYGPSLAETYHEINRYNYLPIMTVSGAHDFLLARDLHPTFHVHIDPRPYHPSMLRKPNPGTRYLMASVCPPDFWRVLDGQKVELWHLINDEKTVEWVREHHPEGVNSMIGGGSTVGQRALNVAAALGYRRFRIFGMDCSFGPDHWAGPHPGNEEPIITVQADGHTFTTTPHLWQAAREMCEFLDTADVQVEMFGEGLLQSVARPILRKRAL